MAHLCIDARLINASGIGSFLKTILSELMIDPFFDLTLLINRSEKWTKFENLSANFIELTSSIYSMSEQIELFKKIPKTDLFWSPHVNIPLFPIPAKKRIVTIHDCFHLTFAQNYSLFKKLYARAIYNAAVKYSHCLMTVSHFSKNEIRRHCFFKKECKVIYNGIDHTHFYQKKWIAEKETHAISLPQFFFLAVGNVKPHKNLLNLVKAFTILKKKNEFNHFKLVIIGKKEGFISQDFLLQNELEKHPFINDIIFTGFVKDSFLPVAYSCASAFVFPSLYEGFGLPPIEAMACGCPVIASSSASIPEICADAALYVNPLNPSGIAEAMELVIKNSAIKEEIIKKGLERSKMFDAKLTAKQYLKNFKDLCK